VRTTAARTGVFAATVIQAHRSDLKQQCRVPATSMSLLETSGRYEGLLIRHIAERRTFGHYGDKFPDFS
jgi:hypothetical protein